MGTYDGASVKLYVNGALQFTTSHTGTFSSDTTGITIGASHNDASHQAIEGFNGAIDEVTLYNRALSAQEVQQLYQGTTGSPDTTLPDVSISAPAAGATVSGAAVAVSATASDNAGVARVQFQLDGVNLGAAVTSAPYSMTWNTTGTGNGSHTLTAIASRHVEQHADLDAGRRHRGECGVRFQRVHWRREERGARIVGYQCNHRHADLRRHAGSDVFSVGSAGGGLLHGHSRDTAPQRARRH